jgi:hypothetical protein
MKRLVPLSLLLLPGLLLAAEPSPAAGIAAKVIRERATEIERGGQAAVAGELRMLAEQLAGGTVSLADAALVVQIALAGNPRGPAAPMQTAEQRRAAEQAASRASAILDGETPTPVASKPVPAAPPIDEKALAIPVATSVLIADWVGEPKSLLVMIGVGKDQHISAGQRFVVKRGEQKLAVISATQVKEASTICMAVAGTLAEGVQIKAGDAVVSE